MPNSWKYKGIDTFPKDINPKVNVRPRLEFELTKISQLLKMHSLALCFKKFQN